MQHRIKISKTNVKLFLDILMTLTFVVAMKPRFTGEGWHEWVGLALGGAAIIHILLNIKWVFTVTRRFFRKVGRQNRINYLLNLALFVSFVLTVVSGIMISKNLNTAQYLNIGGDAMLTWKELHVWIPNVTLLILGVHLALHWKWIVFTTRRLLSKLIPGRAAKPRRVIPQLGAQN